MTLSAEHIPEPLLEFGHGQVLEHPKDGLFLYGPLAEPGAPAVVRVGAVGTQQGLGLLRNWLRRLPGRIDGPEESRLHAPAWPGFETCFSARLAETPIAEAEVAEDDVRKAILRSNKHDAVRSAVRLFDAAIRGHLRREEARPDVWIVVVPEIVYRYGRPQSGLPPKDDRIPSSVASLAAASRVFREGSLFAEFEEEAELYLFASDFHHQLKAELLDIQAALQLIRESTIDRREDGKGGRTRGLQDEASTAWNFATTLYFKANGKPWRLAGVRDGVCYVGLAFRKDQTPASRGEVCCAAQMFLDSGDGVVFKGALGPWQSERPGEFHLSEEAAADLMSSVVREYERIKGRPPSELFVHARQRFNDAEWNGFSSAAKAGNLVGVRMRPSQDLRLFRPAARTPVLRGTAVRVSRREGYLWTTGYVPRLRVYQGFRTSKPLLVEVCRGAADLGVVMQDVLGLTKVNYNACEFASGEPVTLKFATRIGEIVMASPKVGQLAPMPFRYYI